MIRCMGGVLMMLAAMLGKCAPVEQAPQIELHFTDMCRVHRVALLDGEARIAYGLPMRGPDERAKVEYPNARTSVRGGCVVGEQRTVKVKYCSACRDAEAKARGAAARLRE